MFGLKRRQLLTLAVLVSGTFIAILNQTILGPALPKIMVEMNISASTAQWLTTGFTLVNAVMIPVSGYLTDRFSVKSLFITSMCVFTAGSLVAGAAFSFEMLLAGRLVQAAGAGVLMPMVMTVMLLTFPIENRGTAMGVFSVIIGFAPTIGPVIAGMIVDGAGWNVMFFGVAALAAIDVLCAVFMLQRGMGGNPAVKGVDKLSLVQSTVGFGGLLYGFSEVGNSGLTPLSIAMTIVGAVVLVFFFRRQNRLAQPMLRVEVLKSQKFFIGTVIGMIVQAAIMANGVILPIYIQTVMGQTATTAALVMLPASILIGIMGPIAGRIFDKHGPRKMSIIGLCMLLGGTLMMTQLSLETSMTFVAAVMCVRLFGISLVNMSIATWALNALDNKVINHGNAVKNTLRQVAGALGTAIVISAYSLWTGMRSETVDISQAQVDGMCFCFALQAAFILVALIITVILVRDRAEDSVKADPEGERKRMIESVMSRNVIMLTNTMTVADAARIFAELKIDGLPIIDREGKPVGFISDGDLMRALTPQREGTAIDFYALADNSNRIDPDIEKMIKRVMELPVTSIASSRLIGVDIHATTNEVNRLLSVNSMRRLPVFENGLIVGMINRSDITAYILGRYLDRIEDDESDHAATVAEAETKAEAVATE